MERLRSLIELGIAVLRAPGIDEESAEWLIESMLPPYGPVRKAW